MGLFNDMLKSGETIFKDTIALDYDFIPKLIPFREQHQKKIAAAISPLFDKRNGRNVLVHGKPGVGKTVAIQNVLQELKEESDDITPIYVNCWEHNSTFKIFNHMCAQLDFKFINNKRSDELFKMLKRHVNKGCAVFVFDEIDKIEDHDFLYTIIENIYRKSIILISNYKDWISNLDGRIKSRLLPDLIEFLPYNENETTEILKQRLKYAFVNEVWNQEAFNKVASKTCEMQDIRSGLYLLKESGEIAQGESSKKITADHVATAIKKLEDFTVKDKENLQDDSRSILQLIKENQNSKIGSLFKLYNETGGDISYKTFQRRIKKLEIDGFIHVKKVTDKEGNTSIIKTKDISKKLSEFS